METNRLKSRFSKGVFLVVRFFVKLFYPKTEIHNIEKLPDEPCIVVANHCKMNGPIIGELYFPGDRAVWCAGQMMELKAVPDYAYQDFWCEKPKYIRWFYRLLSYLIAPLCVCVFNNAKTIAVHRDTRIISCFRQTVSGLKEGKNIIIFPEHYAPHNHIVNDFQDKFIDVAKHYCRSCGKELYFVPMYIAPELKGAWIGEPVRYDPAAPASEERKRICQYLMDEITKTALSLPRHRVIQYNNLPRKKYPYNIPAEETKET